MTRIMATAKRTMARYSEKGTFNYVWIILCTVTLMLVLSISACNSLRLDNVTFNQVAPLEELQPNLDTIEQLPEIALIPPEPGVFPTEAPGDVDGIPPD